MVPEARDVWCRRQRRCGGPHPKCQRKRIPAGTRLSSDIGRLRRVTEIAAEKAGWGKRKVGKGTGLGIAAQRYSFTYVASVVEIEVTEKGDIRILRVDTAVDAGTAVNPANVRAQLEGAAVFGTSIALGSEITATNGVIDQSNFHNYPVARINEAPYQTNVYVVDSSAPPAGVGEPGCVADCAGALQCDLRRYRQKD
jgi:isoquinoline 1-oxidoreductase beta subunit